MGYWDVTDDATWCNHQNPKKNPIKNPIKIPLNHPMICWLLLMILGADEGFHVCDLRGSCTAARQALTGAGGTGASGALSLAMRGPLSGYLECDILYIHTTLRINIEYWMKILGLWYSDVFWCILIIFQQNILVTTSGVVEDYKSIRSYLDMYSAN